MESRAYKKLKYTINMTKSSFNLKDYSTPKPQKTLTKSFPSNMFSSPKHHKHIFYFPDKTYTALNEEQN